MARLADLNVRIGATIRGLQTGLKNAEKSLKQSGSRLSSIGQDLTAKVSLPLAAIGGAALKSFADFERLEKAFEAVAGSAELATQQIDSLRVVARNPGITFDQAVAASLKLQGLGFTAQKAEESIRQVGNAIAVSGGTSREFEGVIRQLGQIQAKNRVLQEDVGILLENAPVLGKVLQDTFGGRTAEAIRDAGVNGEQFVSRLIGGLQKVERVEGGLSNAFENFGIALKVTLAEVGRDLDNAFNITSNLDSLSSTISKIGQSFSSLSPSVKQAIAVFGLVALALPPLITAFGALQVALASAFAPVTLFVGGMAALTAAFTFAYNESEQFRRVANGVGAALVTLGQIIASQVIDRFTFLKDTIVDLVTNGFRLLFEVGNTLIIPFQLLTRFLTGEASAGFENFGSNGATVLENLSGNILGFVSGVRSVFQEFIRILNEGVGAFIEGFEKVQEGDISGALSAFGTAISKSNPVGIALTQGQRLANTFNEGFKSGFENNAITDIRESFERGFRGSNAVQVEVQPTTSGGTFDFSGGDAVSATGSSAGTAKQEVFDLNNNLGEFVKTVQDAVTPTTQLGEALRNNLIDGGQAAFLTRTQQAVLGFAQTSETAISPLVSIGEQLEIIANKSEVLGAAFDADTARLDLYKSSLQNLLNEGLSPQSNAIQTLIDKITELEEKQAPFTALETSAKAAANAFSNAASTSAKSFSEIGKSALSSASQVVKAKIVESIAAYIASSFGKLGIFGTVLAAGAGAVVGGLFNKVLSSVNVPALASGGLAFGETLALVGDNPNASTDPEVIAPLSKLKQFIQPNGGSGFVASTRISGSDLEVIINRAIDSKLRTR